MNSGLSKSLWEGLKDSEKLFHTTMRSIYEKYDHVFVDDVVVNIIDFTCSCSDVSGPIPWDYETYTPVEGKPKKGKKEQLKTFIQAFPIGRSIEISEDTPNATCLLPKETSDGIFSRTFIMEEKSKSKDFDSAQLEHYEDIYTTVNLSPSIKLSAGTKETCFMDGHKQFLMSSTGSNIGNKTFFVSPLDTSVSMPIKSFIRRQNNDCSFEDTREIFYDYEADESRLQHLKETAYCDSGDTSLANHYPDMVECIRRLWEMPRKKRAADNIVQYYKRHVWNASKKLPTSQMFYRPPNSRSMHPFRKYETNKGCSRYMHALYQSKNLKNSSFRESAVHCPGAKTFNADSNKDRSKNLDIFVTKQNKVDTPDVGSCMKEQNVQILVMKGTPVRRNISSMFPLMQSPKAKSKMGFEVLDETFTYQNQMETGYANGSPFYSTNPLLEVTSVLSRSQEFTLSDSPIKNSVVLNTSMDSEASTLCKTFLKQNQERSYNTDSFYINKQQTFKYTKQPETCDVKSSFQENVKWFQKVAGSSPRLSPTKQSAMLKCRTDHNNTSLDKTFNNKEPDRPFPGSSFSAFPALLSPSKNTVTLRSNVESDSCCIKEQKRQSIKYIKQQETPDVNASFQDIKWFPKVSGTPSKMSSGKLSVALKCKMNPCITSLDNTFICQSSVKVNEVKSFKSKEKDEQPSHTQAVVRRNSFSALPLEPSPESNATSYFSLNNTTINLDKTVTYQEDLKNVEVAASCNSERSRRFFRLEDSLGRRNSFSSLPVIYNLVREKKIPDVMFEDVYRMKTVNGFHSPVQAQSSKVVWSLVNSPGSRRWKRQASKNLSFSTFKRQKSADETFIKSNSNTTKPSSDKSSLMWQKTTTFIPKPGPDTK